MGNNCKCHLVCIVWFVVWCLLKGYSSVTFTQETAGLKVRDHLLWKELQISAAAKVLKWTFDEHGSAWAALCMWHTHSVQPLGPCWQLMHGADLIQRGGSPPNYYEVTEMSWQHSGYTLVYCLCAADFFLLCNFLSKQRTGSLEQRKQMHPRISVSRKGHKATRGTKYAVTNICAQIVSFTLDARKHLNGIHLRWECAKELLIISGWLHVE